LGLRLRAPDGADEPAALGDRHLLHLHQPPVLVPLVEPGAGGREVRRRRVEHGAAGGGRAPRRAVQDVSQGEPGAANFDDLLVELRDLVESARTMPMSASVLVNREEILGLVDEIFAGVPEEVRHARWLLKERDEFLASARREADDIIESARVQAERMVERTEIAREARRIAQKTVDDADAQARRLRL